MIPYPAHFTVTQSFTSDELKRYKRDTTRALKAQRSFFYQLSRAQMRQSITRFFSRSTSGAAVSALAVVGLTPLVGIYA